MNLSRMLFHPSEIPWAIRVYPRGNEIQDPENCDVQQCVLLHIGNVCDVNQYVCVLCICWTFRWWRARAIASRINLNDMPVPPGKGTHTHYASSNIYIHIYNVLYIRPFVCCCYWWTRSNSGGDRGGSGGGGDDGDGTPKGRESFETKIRIYIHAEMKWYRRFARNNIVITCSVHIILCTQHNIIVQIHMHCMREWPYGIRTYDRLHGVVGAIALVDAREWAVGFDANGNAPTTISFLHFLPFHSVVCFITNFTSL